MITGASAYPDPFSILMIEDDINCVQILQTSLLSLFAMQSKPLNFVAVKCLREAFGELENMEPDVIILDLNLPPESTAMDSLMQIPNLAVRAPVIVLTGMDENLTAQSIDYGAEDFLPKSRILDVRSNKQSEWILLHAINVAVLRRERHVTTRTAN